MAVIPEGKRVSVSLPPETYARLMALRQAMGKQTGLPFVSLSNVAALAVDQGLQRIMQDKQNAAVVS